MATAKAREYIVAKQYRSSYGDIRIIYYAGHNEALKAPRWHDAATHAVRFQTRADADRVAWELGGMVLIAPNG
jgi:hypothetical protein